MRRHVVFRHRFCYALRAIRQLRLAVTMNLGVIALLFIMLAAPAASEAQAPGKTYRIGYLSLQREEGDKSWVAAFRQGLRDLGYVEGENIVIHQRHAAGRAERLSP